MPFLCRIPTLIEIIFKIIYAKNLRGMDVPSICTHRSRNTILYSTTQHYFPHRHFTVGDAARGGRGRSRRYLFAFYTVAIAGSAVVLAHLWPTKVSILHLIHIACGVWKYLCGIFRFIYLWKTRHDCQWVNRSLNLGSWLSLIDAP